MSLAETAATLELASPLTQFSGQQQGTSVTCRPDEPSCRVGSRIVKKVAQLRGPQRVSTDDRAFLDTQNNSWYNFRPMNPCKTTSGHAKFGRENQATDVTETLSSEIPAKWHLTATCQIIFFESAQNNKTRRLCKPPEDSATFIQKETNALYD